MKSGRSVLWLREILTAKEQQANPAAESSAGDAPGIIQDQLFRATDELCETRIEAAEMHARYAPPPLPANMRRHTWPLLLHWCARVFAPSRPMIPGENHRHTSRTALWTVVAGMTSSNAKCSR
jgi:hypothetical protein